VRGDVLRCHPSGLQQGHACQSVVQVVPSGQGTDKENSDS
jgi:hypothetical protein